MNPRPLVRSVTTAFLAAVLVILCGCSKDRTAEMYAGLITPMVRHLPPGEAASISTNPGPPSTLATISTEGQSLTLWPFTGSSFDTPSDPVNLVFVGDVDPVKIRAALLALDGDRTAFGIPNTAPFNERWADAHGSVQTAYAEPGGWSGSVIQLRLGQYGPVRVHLRLFRTRAPFGSGGTWTVGGAHFELLVPGTADHWVLSWKLARDIVTADLARSGLLVAPPSFSNAIGPSPTYRDIPPAIYNGLPPELKGLIGGPQGSVSSPVPLENDGRAAVFHLEHAPGPIPGTFHQNFTIAYGQLIPKPLCSDGPYDYVYVEGPVDFEATAQVDDAGRYSFSTRYSGSLRVTPMDVTENPPAPAGPSFTALVSELQSGQTGGSTDMAFSRSRLLGQEAGGADIKMTDLKVSSTGVQEYRSQTQCLQP